MPKRHASKSNKQPAPFVCSSDRPSATRRSSDRSSASSLGAAGAEVFGEMFGEGALELPFQSVVKFFVTATKPSCSPAARCSHRSRARSHPTVAGGAQRVLLRLGVHSQEQGACWDRLRCLAHTPPPQLILTNAHVVDNYTTVRVRKNGGSDKFTAEVLYINQSCDLAVATVHDENFWKVAVCCTQCRATLLQDLPALEIAPSVPNLYDNVMVIGYPLGGDNISVTRGVVSRCDNGM